MNKTTHKLLSLLCSAALLLTLLPAGAIPSHAASTVVEEGTCGENVTWTLTDDGVLTIEGEGGMANYQESIHSVPRNPWRGKSFTAVVISEGVTSIGSYAFFGCPDLTEVTVPSSVTSIGDCAFLGTPVTSITTSNGLISIGYRAFYNCKQLTGFSFPGSLISIGEEAFFKCSALTDIQLPDSLISIGKNAFGECTSLTGAVLPSSLTEIPDSLFYCCSSLTSIKIPDAVTTIGTRAFARCTALAELDLESDITTIEDYAFSGCENLTALDLPDSVSHIGMAAFQNCIGLTQVKLPEALTYLGDSAFHDCTGLTAITLGQNISTIQNGAFAGCAQLASIVIPDSVTYLGVELFLNCTSLSSVTLPASLKSIPGSMFRNCTSLTDITIPASVTNIQGEAFCNCTGLTDLELPAGVTFIGHYAFSGCNGLTGLVLPDQLIELDTGAFSFCNGLTAVTIPASVTSIGLGVFEGCSALRAVRFLGDAPELFYGFLYEIEATCFYPAGNTSWENSPFESWGDMLTWKPCLPCETHSYQTVALEPGCTTPGYTAHICSACGDSYQDNFLPAAGHRFELSDEWPASCTHDGTLIYSCPVCWAGYQVPIPATGHSFELSETTDATCTEDGCNIFVCSCGYRYEESVAPATGHAFGEWYLFREAVCALEGEERRDCSVCGYFESRIFPPDCPSYKFMDMDRTSWYHPYVDFVVERGLMSGTGGDLFEPTSNITRASVAVLLWNMAGQPEHHVTENPFHDVKEGFWYTNAIFWAYENGVVSGNGAGGFNPNDNVTREQLAVMLYNFSHFMGYELTAVRDVDLASFPDGATTSTWAASYLKWACDLGLINGKAQGGQNFLAPRDTATRAEIAVIFTNFTKLVENA